MEKEDVNWIKRLICSHSEGCLLEETYYPFFFFLQFTDMCSYGWRKDSRTWLKLGDQSSFQWSCSSCVRPMVSVTVLLIAHMKLSIRFLGGPQERKWHCHFHNFSSYSRIKRRLLKVFRGVSPWLAKSYKC